MDSAAAQRVPVGVGLAGSGAHTKVAWLLWRPLHDGEGAVFFVWDQSALDH